MTNVTHNVIIDNYRQEISEFVSKKFEQLSCDLAIVTETPEMLLKVIGKKIRSIACDVYKIEELDILKKRCGDGLSDISETIVVILKTHTSFTNEQITSVVNKKPNKVYVSKINHSKKDPKFKHHKIYLDNFKIIEEAFIEFKNNGYKD